MTTPETTTVQPEAPYHHGDLPNALRTAAAYLIAERGLGAFSLREVARRAGVSHAAPAHHFGDSTGLLTSVAVEGFGKLRDEVAREAAGIDDPAAVLIAVGRAYVQTAVQYPGHFQVMFRTDVVDTSSPALLQAGQEAYGALEGAVRDFAAAENPALNVTEAAGLCWSMAQGLVELYPKMVLIGEVRGPPAAGIEELVARFTTLIINGLRAQ